MAVPVLVTAASGVKVAPRPVQAKGTAPPHLKPPDPRTARRAQALLQADSHCEGGHPHHGAQLWLILDVPACPPTHRAILVLSLQGVPCWQQTASLTDKAP